MVSFFHFHHFTWKFCIVTVVSLCFVVVSWPSTEAWRPGKNNEGSAHMGISSAASDPCSVCTWWVFSGALSFVLPFSIVFSTAEIPRGQNQEQNCGAEAPVVFMSQFWDTTGFSPLTLEVQDTAGHKSQERRGGTELSREKECDLCRCCTSTSTETRPFPPHHGSCPSSLDICLFPRGNFCTDARKWVQREYLHVPWARVCMILCKFMENSCSFHLFPFPLDIQGHESQNSRHNGSHPNKDSINPAWCLRLI